MTPLAPADVLALEGPDAIAFAQAQFANDVLALADGRWHWNSWLDAQGRVRAFFALLRPDATRLLAWLPLGGADAMRAGLTPFLFRSKVALRALEGWQLAGEVVADAVAYAGVLTPSESGFRFSLGGAPSRAVELGPAKTAVYDAAALRGWRLADIDARLPLLDPSLAGEFVAAALGLDALGAVSVRKGCYPGQEIVARLHFRGGNKRGVRKLVVDAAHPPAAGAPVQAQDGSVIGRVLYATRGIDEAVALAILPLDAVAAGLAVALDDRLRAPVLALSP